MGAGRTSVVCRRDVGRREREAESDGSMPSSSSSSYGASTWMKLSELVLLRLRLLLDVGECTDALPPEELPLRSGYTPTTRSEPELSVNFALLVRLSSAICTALRAAWPTRPAQGGAS